jgi:hypothetical protein
MPTIYKDVEVEVDVDLDDFDDDKLIEEIERRGLDLNSKYIDGDQMRELLEQVWHKRRLGQEFQQELDQLIYYGLGRIV